MSLLERLDTLEALWAANSVKAGAADSVHATLREGIITGRLQSGDTLVEEQLASRFRVSRTPVREALLRLEAEHLVTRIPRRGLVVRRFSEDEVLEVYTVRTALDRLAAGLAATHALPSELAHLRTINQRLADATEQGNTPLMAELSTQFHEALAEASHNSLLLHFTRQLNDRVRRFGASTFAHPGRPAIGIAEHEQLLEALDARDVEEAERIALDHNRNAHQARLAMLRNEAGSALQ